MNIESGRYPVFWLKDFPEFSSYFIDENELIESYKNLLDKDSRISLINHLNTDPVAFIDRIVLPDMIVSLNYNILKSKGIRLLNWEGVGISNMEIENSIELSITHEDKIYRYSLLNLLNTNNQEVEQIVKFGISHTDRVNQELSFYMVDSRGKVYHSHNDREFILSDPTLFELYAYMRNKPWKRALNSSDNRPENIIPQFIEKFRSLLGNNTRKDL